MRVIGFQDLNSIAKVYGFVSNKILDPKLKSIPSCSMDATVILQLEVNIGLEEVK